jgi:hypothetical protein
MKRTWRHWLSAFLGHGAKRGGKPRLLVGRDHLKKAEFRGGHLDKEGVNSCNDGV